MTWKDLIKEETDKDYFKNITKYLVEDGKKYKIFPPHKDVFNAFDYCKLEDTKVVILGQDPYIKEGQAHGLSFSVPDGMAIPPSLKNIFKEIKSDLNIDCGPSGSLIPWAKQGVLLLNASLTVREGASGSHARIGWQTFTDAAINVLNDQGRPIVYILWGNFARSKKKLITDKHIILESSHPSPLSCFNGFFGSKPFSKTNQFLIDNNIKPINWNNND